MLPEGCDERREIRTRDRRPMREVDKISLTLRRAGEEQPKSRVCLISGPELSESVHGTTRCCRFRSHCFSGTLHHPTREMRRKGKGNRLQRDGHWRKDWREVDGKSGEGERKASQTSDRVTHLMMSRCLIDGPLRVHLRVTVLRTQW